MKNMFFAIIFLIATSTVAFAQKDSWQVCRRDNGELYWCQVVGQPQNVPSQPLAVVLPQPPSAVLANQIPNQQIVESTQRRMQVIQSGYAGFYNGNFYGSYRVTFRRVTMRFRTSYRTTYIVRPQPRFIYQHYCRCWQRY